jgi:hypothetical protein
MSGFSLSVHFLGVFEGSGFTMTPKLHEISGFNTSGDHLTSDMLWYLTQVWLIRAITRSLLFSEHSSLEFCRYTRITAAITATIGTITTTIRATTHDYHHRASTITTTDVTTTPFKRLTKSASPRPGQQ